MKIIIPNICYEDNFEDNVSYTLRKMGHEVLTMPRQLRVLNDNARHIIQQVEARLFPNRFSLQEKWLLQVYKEFKPDLVLCLTQALNEEVLLELKSKSILTICWWGDTAANMQKQGLLCYGWDFVFIKDRFAVQKLRSLDINAHHLHEAMNPDWHKWNSIEGNNNLLFAGNTYEYRHFLLRKLIAENQYQITLFGNKLPRWVAPEILPVYTHKYIVKEEKSMEFGSALACINSTSMTEFDSLNCRAFEIAGAGITDHGASSRNRRML
ncbi:MAG: hypothetical protein IPJ09_13155 [Saprospiraceae bacterium]|nr:hypothetical protein [Saprospiraceae bacterium]